MHINTSIVTNVAIFREKKTEIPQKISISISNRALTAMDTSIVTNVAIFRERKTKTPQKISISISTRALTAMDTITCTTNRRMKEMQVLECRPLFSTLYVICYLLS